jgi:hypothetical protein
MLGNRKRKNKTMQIVQQHEYWKGVMFGNFHELVDENYSPAPLWV